MLERSIINRYCSDSAFEATDFTGCSQTWCSTLLFVAGSLNILKIKLQSKNMKNNVVFITPLKFQDNLWCNFFRFSTKSAKSKVFNYLLVDSVFYTIFLYLLQMNNCYVCYKRTIVTNFVLFLFLKLRRQTKFERCCFYSYAIKQDALKYTKRHLSLLRVPK